MGQTIFYILISTVICVAYFTGRSLPDGYAGLGLLVPVPQVTPRGVEP